MKRTRLVLGCVVLQLIWLIVPNEALAAEEYLPMAKGMEWVMDLEATSPQGDKTNGVARRRIEQKVEQDGKGYLRSHTWVEGDRPFAMDYTKLVRAAGRVNGISVQEVQATADFTGATGAQNSSGSNSSASKNSIASPARSPSPITS